VQLLLFLLFNALIFGLGPWPILVPVTGLFGVPGKTMGDAFGALQYMLYQLVVPWIALASIFISAAIVGRAFCAWACPFGLVQDVVNFFKRQHTNVSLRTHNQIIKVKYVILTFTVFISIALTLAAGYRESLGVFAMAPFNMFSPADTLFAVIPRTVLDVNYAIPLLFEKAGGEVLGAITSSIASVSPLFWARLFILALTLILVLYIPRGWCRYLCPQGAFSALFSRFSFLGLRRDLVRCKRVGCRDCVEVCPMIVPILDQPWEKFTHPECIMCLKCVDVCSTKAIKLKFP
jgi:polyferredoxin